MRNIALFSIIALLAATITPQQSQAAPTPQSGSAPVVGWICTVGSRRNLQFYPCPSTVQRGQSIDVDGYSDATGEPIHGTGTVQVQVPVTSQPLTAEGVCAALGDDSIHVKHSGSSDVYERNVLRSKYC